MTSADLASDVIRDLLRSGWLIEKARSHVYGSWDMASAADRAERRAELLAKAIEETGKQPDHHLVDLHNAWVGDLVGSDPDAVPLASIFLVRIGDWVDLHTGPFLGDATKELVSLGDEERNNIRLPSSMPSTPPFARIEIPETEPPGPVLFRFGILADMHIGSAQGDALVRAAIEDLNRSGSDFVIQLGDITDHGDRSEFDAAREVLGLFEMPVTTMMGNHDVYSLGEARLSGREYYSNSFGREPDGVVIHHKGFRFAVLDSVEHGVSPFSPFDIVSGRFVEEQAGGAIVRGALSHPQHDILADVAAPGGGPAFVFLHHPPQPFTGFPPVLFGLRDEDSGRLHATCDSGNVWGIFAGHTHRNARTVDLNGVPAHEVAIARDFPHGYATVDVCENGYVYRFHQISNDELLAAAYERSGAMLRRYGAGKAEERAFVWTKGAD